MPAPGFTWGWEGAVAQCWLFHSWGELYGKAKEGCYSIIEPPALHTPVYLCLGDGSQETRVCLCHSLPFKGKRSPALFICQHLNVMYPAQEASENEGSYSPSQPQHQYYVMHYKPTELRRGPHIFKTQCKQKGSSTRGVAGAIIHPPLVCGLSGTHRANEQPGGLAAQSS